MLLNVVRMKFAAILLGPAGVGLFSTFNNLVGVMNDLSGLGIGNSGVRQIAEAAGDEDETRIAVTVRSYRILVWVTGIGGVLLMVALALPLSLWTFDSNTYVWSIVFLSAAMLQMALANGQSCLLQGLRRIADLSKIRIFSAIGGCIATLICLWLWKLNGIVPALVLSASAVLVCSWFFSRKIQVRKIHLGWDSLRHESWRLISLGSCFMVSGLVASGGIYLQKILLIREFDLKICGIFQASYTLSGILVTFVLNAMGTDYYPRLTRLLHSPGEMQDAVNDQQEISLLLAFPCLLGMLIFAPLVIYVFYSRDFQQSIPLLRLFIFGILMRVFSWPLGFLILAYGHGRLIVVSETMSGIVHLGFFYLGLRYWGLAGAAAALFGMYFCYSIYLILLAHFYYGIKVQKNIYVLLAAMLCTLVLAQIWQYGDLSRPLSWGGNLLLLAAASAVSLKILTKRLGFGRVSDALAGLRRRFLLKK